MEYSYGDADDAWQEVALAVARSDAKLLVCDVAVAERYSRRAHDYWDDDDEYRGTHRRHHSYGEEGEDDEMGRDGDHYGEEEGEEDEMGRFRHHDGEEEWMDDDRSRKEGLLRFLHERASVWVGLPGQEEWLHQAAQRFVGASSDEDRRVEIAFVEGLDGGTRAKSSSSVYYAKLMKKLLVDGSCVQKEGSRLRKMLSDQALSESKR
ncbi:MAG: hypothetical protein SGPRY_011861 [Prymnesium sp.]